jgi:hypothetical protein
MFLQRFPFLTPIVSGLKSGVDWIFPGALWSWEALGTFLFSCILFSFGAYAIAAWSLIGAPSAIKLRWVLVPLLVFQCTLVFVPASMTTDIYNYALYGEMPVLYDANPFVRTPSEFPQSPLFYLIPLYWHDAPSVYGPLWIAVSAGVAALFRAGPLADELLSYRLIANVAHLVNTLLIWALARRLHAERAPSAALAYAWNPLLLVDFALNGHNDVVMLSFVLAAFLLASARRHTLAAIGLGLSVAMKYTSILVAPLLLVWSARQHRGLRAQIWSLCVGGGLLGLLVAAFYAPWFEGLGTFGPVLYWMSGPRLNNFWPEPTLISLTAWTSGLLGTSYEAAWDAIFPGFKLIAKIGFAAYVVYQAIRAERLEDVLASSARVTLVFLLLVNTWVMPWYYSWPLAFAAALGWHAVLVRVCAGFTLTAMLLMYQRQYAQSFVADWAGVTLILPLLLVAAPMVFRWLQPRFSGRLPRLPSLPANAPFPATSQQPSQQRQSDQAS